MIETISDILIKKYKENSLASLYIANYNSERTNPKIWADDFLKNITTIEDHPDVLKLNKSEKEKEYKVESPAILELYKFINYKPLNLKKKFIFLFDSQDISTIVANKLLKIFEELSSDICLILFAPDNAAMLPTVTSRAIKIQISNLNKTDIVPNENLDHITSPQELIAYLKQSRLESNQLEKKFIEQKIEQCLKNAHDPKNYQQLDELLLSLKDFELSSDFNNSQISRISRFFP